ncbi:hypothetical protein [Micromonospora parathelypteridis]|uniref:hypothetical protein n=1 Tax=Micromonospora parathelypteridis TaxID=1839617 RepID=UPI00402B08AA
MPVAPAALRAASGWRSVDAEAVFGAAAFVGETGVPVPPGPPALSGAPAAGGAGGVPVAGGAGGDDATAGAAGGGQLGCDGAQPDTLPDGPLPSQPPGAGTAPVSDG